MSSDFGVREPQEFVLLCPKHPFSPSLWLPVSMRDPRIPFIGMSVPAPLPCHRPEVVVQFPESLCSNIVAVVICPASNDRVQGSDKRVLSPGARFFHCSPDLFHDRLDRLLGRLDEQFPVVFPEIVTQKVKSFVDVSDHGLLSRQFEAAFGKEFLDDVSGFFCDLLCRSRDEEVIRIANEVDFHPGEVCREQLFDPIQRHVGEEVR